MITFISGSSCVQEGPVAQFGKPVGSLEPGHGERAAITAITHNRPSHFFFVALYGGKASKIDLGAYISLEYVEYTAIT